MMVQKEFSFSEEGVREWCEQADDSNQLHLSEETASEHELFDERVVPGMMLLDKVSGLITVWGEATDSSATPVLSRVSSTVFNKPVYFDETVGITIEEKESQEDMYILRFEVTDSVAAEPRVQGFVTVYLL